MFAKIENNTPVEYPIVNIAIRFPNTSFPSDPRDADLPAGYVRVYAGPIPQASNNEKVVTSMPVFSNNRWVQGYEVQPLTSEEVVERLNIKTTEVRSQRNQLLAESDWTQGKDIPNAVSEPWAVYRQLLRDVTNQQGFPYQVTWPVLPSAL
jgi:hypothetical protein